MREDEEGRLEGRSPSQDPRSRDQALDTLVACDAQYLGFKPFQLAARPFTSPSWRKTAREAGVKGRSQMDRDQLIAALS